MPYVEGESLRDRLARDRQLPVDDAVRIAGTETGLKEGRHGYGTRFAGGVRPSRSLG